MGYVLLVGLPCLASVREDMPNLGECARVGKYPGGVPTHSKKGGEWGGRIVGRSDQEGAVSRL